MRSTAGRSGVGGGGCGSAFAGGEGCRCGGRWFACSFGSCFACRRRRRRRRRRALCSMTRTRNRHPLYTPITQTQPQTRSRSRTGTRSGPTNTTQQPPRRADPAVPHFRQGRCELVEARDVAPPVAGVAGDGVAVVRGGVADARDGAVVRVRAVRAWSGGGR